jgi:hypothetical protein
VLDENAPAATQSVKERPLSGGDQDVRNERLGQTVGKPLDKIPSLRGSIDTYHVNRNFSAGS